MADLIDITSNVLSQNTICFETRNINSEQIPVPFEDAKFGILNFIAVNTEETSEEIDFLFVVDCSGSMSDRCADGRSKMQHIIHTLKNMILFFHEHPNAKIHFTINTFDTKIYPIVTRTKITDENINEIIYQIEKISPRGSTNIEFALRKSAEEIIKLQTQFPTNTINHIFMTDGEATDGSKDVNLLKTIVNHNVTNAFIGFGVEHDASLLNGISSVSKGGYYFIDKLERAGLVYGEILHGMIYKLITDAEITIENGLVYDYKNNTWVDTLKIGDIASEANKTYNIISSNTEYCSVNIKGRVGDLVVIFPATQVETADLTTQIYRQRTLQILYEVNNLSDESSFDGPSTSDEEEKNALKLKLTNFMEEIKKYMTDNHLEEDKILKNLCDDIYICYRTFGTKFGTMYCTSRRTSQGTQRGYTVSSIVDTHTEEFNGRTIRRTNGIYGPPPLYRLPSHRQPNSAQADEELLNDFSTPILQHTISDFASTPYLTPQATQLMREISRPMNGDNEYEFEEQDKSTQ